jgi:dCMP deaminase
MNWHDYYVNMLPAVAAKSKDPHTQVGSIIVGPDHEIRSTGYNGLPRGADDSKLERFQRPEKYLWIEHAERNAIYNAARVGTAINGCTIYVSLLPCIDCARAVISSGVDCVVVDHTADQAWCSTATQYIQIRSRVQQLFAECGVQLIFHTKVDS